MLIEIEERGLKRARDEDEDEQRYKAMYNRLLDNALRTKPQRLPDDEVIAVADMAFSATLPLAKENIRALMEIVYVSQPEDARKYIFENVLLAKRVKTWNPQTASDGIGRLGSTVCEKDSEDHTTDQQHHPLFFCALCSAARARACVLYAQWN